MKKIRDSRYGNDRPMDRLALSIIYLQTGMIPEDLEKWMTPEQKAREKRERRTQEASKTSPTGPDDQ